MRSPAYKPLEWNVPWLVSIGAGTYAFLGGLLSFIGWVADVERFKDWWGSGITIKANTALAITLCAAALLCATLYPSARKFIRGLAVFVATLGALTLLEHPTGWNLGIDTLLFDEPIGAAATAAPGRMGPPAAFSFLALGAALALRTRNAQKHSLGVGLALTVLGISTLSLVGYWYGAEAMYTIPRLTGIALQTATMILALSIGVVAAHADSQPIKTLREDSNAGVLARRLTAVTFVVPLVLGWLRIQGQRIGLYDYAFGTALRTVVEIALLGGMVWWSIQAIRLRDARQRRAEAARQEIEQRMRSVLDASAVPFTLLTPIKDASGSIIDFRWAYLNPAAASAAAKNASELIGKCIGEVFPGTWDEPGLFESYAAVVLRREIREFEYHSVRNGGWFHVVVSPLDGNVAVWFADISERKRQEIELRTVDRRKDEFLATLAHELRNPLAPIRQAAMLSKKANVTDSQRQWCNDVIERQVQHMSLLLEDLLDVSRITRGILQLRKQHTDLFALVETAVETARPTIDSKKHTLKIDLPTERIQLDVDPLRMSQVVSNLLNNAAKYTDTGGAIHLSASVSGADLVLKVADNGIGIPTDELKTIFNMFSQVKKSAQEHSEGLGIGLALTKGLVELHGGTIEAESAGPGLGSIFTLRVPQAVIAAGPQNLRVASLPRPTLCRRILLADDNRDAAESLAMLLRSDGHEVKLAHDGEQALAHLETFAADVALLDIGMPRLSGYDVAKRIRAKNQTVRLIAITGWGQSSDREKSAAAGFDNHLTKPVDYAALTELLAPSANRDRLAV